MKKFIIEKNQDLELLIEDKKDLIVDILVKKQVECNLNLFINTDFKQKINIILEEGSILNSYNLIINSDFFDLNVSLQKQSVYNNLSVYYGLNNDIKSNILSNINGDSSISNIKVKSIANNNSVISLNGLIRMEEVSKNSVANLNLKGILLDKNSSVKLKPNLEVLNDDVNCLHSASIIQIEEEDLFYLKSRGFTKDEAISLILKSYFDYVFLKMNQNFVLNIRDKICI